MDEATLSYMRVAQDDATYCCNEAIRKIQDNNFGSALAWLEDATDYVNKAQAFYEQPGKETA